MKFLACWSVLRKGLQGMADHVIESSTTFFNGKMFDLGNSRCPQDHSQTHNLKGRRRSIVLALKLDAA